MVLSASIDTVTKTKWKLSYIYPRKTEGVHNFSKSLFSWKQKRKKKAVYVYFQAMHLVL